MTKLVIKLSGKAEEGFKELQDLLYAAGTDEKDTVLDALALLHFAVRETAKGNQIAIFNPRTKEATPLNLPSLNFKSKAE